MKIKWNPSIKQLQAFKILTEDKQVTELFYGGAAGGGKSYLGCVWIIYSCLKYSGSRWLIGRAVLKALKQSTVLTFLDVCKEWGLKRDVHFKHNISEGVIRFQNGSEVYLKDLELKPSDKDFDSLGSTEYTGAFIDEASQVTKKAKDIVSSRLRYKLEEFGLTPKLFISSNPSKNFLYTEFYKPNKSKKLPKFRMFIKALVQDNPFISPFYIESLKRLPKASKERLYFGNFEYEDDPAILMDFDAITDLFTNDFVEKTGKKYLIADLAMRGRDKFVVSIWDGLRGKIVLEKAKCGGKEIEEDIRRIANQHKIPRSHTLIDSDGMGNYLESYINGIVEYKGGETAHEYETYFNTRSECHFRLAELVNKREIFLECTEEQKAAIIEELEQVKEVDMDNDESKRRIIKKEIIKEHVGRSPDYLDILQMRMYFEVRDIEFHVLDVGENSFF